MASKKQLITRRRILGGLPALTVSLTPAACTPRAETTSSAPDPRASQAAQPARPALIETFALGEPPWPTFDPFLFCVHHKDEFPQGGPGLGPQQTPQGRRIGNDFSGKDGWSMYHGRAVPGFPRHPHRGFETVTITRRGSVDHADSLGATARYGGGDVQWMTAGSGIVHSEMFPLLEEAGDNRAELFQIWLNLPAADKFATPHFSMFWRESVPRVALRDASGLETVATLCAGALNEKSPPSPPPASWASRAEAEVGIWTLSLEPGARFVVPSAAPAVERTFYYFAGESLTLELESGSTALTAGRGARLSAGRALRLVNGSKPSEVLMLQGRPLGEPIVRNGPFVMNTQGEIKQAYGDYRRTRFGGWPWATTEPVHPRESGRFAVHADGRHERPA